jgi:hypothetical protein
MIFESLLIQILRCAKQNVKTLFESDRTGCITAGKDERDQRHQRSLDPGPVQFVRAAPSHRTASIYLGLVLTFQSLGYETHARISISA